ncbi:MAG: hypothetical protein ACFCUJ_16465, partial [Thiotrichales bacterium]
ISVGVACKEASLPDVDSVLVAADKALYAAKQAGRNRSCLSANGVLTWATPHRLASVLAGAFAGYRVSES